MSRHLILASLVVIGSVLRIFAAASVVVVPDEATAVAQAGASPPRLSAARRESGSRCPWLGEAAPQPEKAKEEQYVISTRAAIWDIPLYRTALISARKVSCRSPGSLFNTALI